MGKFARDWMFHLYLQWVCSIKLWTRNLIVCVGCFFIFLKSHVLNEFQDLNNFESDPEEFARTFCKDLGIEDPEVGVSISFKPLTQRKYSKPVIVLCLQGQKIL